VQGGLARTQEAKLWKDCEKREEECRKLTAEVKELRIALDHFQGKNIQDLSIEQLETLEEELQQSITIVIKRKVCCRSLIFCLPRTLA
jgi:hypothetical protein